MPPSIDPRVDPYVLEGRIVTMDDALTVLADGALYIRSGVIEHVRDSGDPAPPGFENARHVRTGDTIYPGLIELHNHLSYNAMPLWDVPRRYTNNGQWKNHEDYRTKITKPSQVLGRSAGVVEALVRWVEVRCLLGGVTTSQGITLATAGGIQKFYEGLIRNVERPLEAGLPKAGTRIANVGTGGAEDYLDTLEENSCYLQHLSEGVDDTARGWFRRLQLDDGTWAITDALCGIHSTALSEEDLEIMADHGGSMVWSPLSNYLLYGDTIDLEAAKDSGILMGIGSDWAPSGSKNLLGELKVAWLASQHHDETFSPADIVAMATRNPARILKWSDAIGTLEPGKRADLMVVNGRPGPGEDDYLHLIEARETSITLVVIDGVPRVGQKSLMNRFGPGTEEIKVGSSKRVLDLDQEDAHPLVREVTFGAAQSRLADAMEHLPDLAEQLDAAGIGPGFSGGSRDSRGDLWRVVLDFELEADEAALARAADPIAPFVQPMELPGICVADDSEFLPTLMAARNLPEFVKEGLPGLYGQSVPIPDSGSFLRDSPPDLDPRVVETTRELKVFLRAWGDLSLDDRRTIARQALILIERNYVHLPLKRAMHAVDPVQQLKLLLNRLDETEPGSEPPEIEFHNELARIFNALRDLHTTYRLPYPFRTRTAWLPFMIEEFWEDGRQRYLVSKVVADAGPPDFVPGCEVLYWNGIPIEQAVARNADRQQGSNPSAWHARGLNTLTLRPLSRGLPPDEEWVTLRYRDLQGKIREWTQEWLVFQPGRGAQSLDPSDMAFAATAMGLDGETDDVQEAKRVLYGGSVAREAEEAARAGRRIKIGSGEGAVPTFLPTVFRARRVTNRHGTFGYVRIFTFNVADADSFVAEFVRLTEEMPDAGLVIDVRGNGGGLIHAAERVLQALTPRRIEPERAQFINSDLNLRLCRRNSPSELFPQLDLQPWLSSMRQSLETGATFSQGYPITPVESCNEIGQRYYGPVILITDGLCYSATDMFAAGFQDHEVGAILGVHENTGAGGANVWSHYQLRSLMGEDGDPGDAYQPLPGGADLRVAIRRTVRVGREAGTIVEDLGVAPVRIDPGPQGDSRVLELHRLTRRDLLEGNVDLIERATSLLSGKPAHPIHPIVRPQDGGLPRLEVETRNVDRLDLHVDSRPRRSFDVTDDSTAMDLNEILGGCPPAALEVELRGFQAGELAASRRFVVECA